MLKFISDLAELPENERFAMAMCDWVALCTETGAFLKARQGMTKWGDKKFTLILPNRTVQERGGFLAYYEWDYPDGRRIIRAFSIEEAIAMANKKLVEMIGERSV
jgi:hypothetical protein